jgi:hypothetical protein
METRKVFAVIGNTDCTEGRGHRFVKEYCDTMATAKRLGRKGYVQGSDCPIEIRTLFKPEGKNEWYGPVKVEPSSQDDIRLQERLDVQNEALEKAKSLGLSDEEIKLIKQHT